MIRCGYLQPSRPVRNLRVGNAQRNPTDSRERACPVVGVDPLTPTSSSWTCGPSLSRPNGRLPSMNQYADLAMRHWKTWLPTRYAELPDPTAFFAALGEEVEQRIAEETTQAASRAPQSEDYLSAVGQWNALRQGAQERVLAEMVLLEPEPQTQDREQIQQDRRDGMPTDPTHPLWVMSEDESVSLEQFRQALLEWRATLPR